MKVVAALAAMAVAVEARGADRFLRTHRSDEPAPAEVVAGLDSAIGVGRDGFHLGFDYRLALGVGVSERLQTRFAVELAAATDEGADEALTTETAWRDGRWEWQLALVDRDALGLSAWLAPGVAVGGPHPGAGPTSADVELGLLFDHTAGRVTFAVDGIAAPVATFERANVVTGATRAEAAARTTISLGAVAVGAGVYGRSVIAGRAAKYVALFAGPTVAWDVPGAWRATLTVAPQLPAPVRATADRAVVLTEYDRLAVVLELGATL